MVGRAAAEIEPFHEKAILRDYIETILVCVIFVVFSRAFVFQQSKIPSGSMMDTLLIGDFIMVNRFVYSTAASALERALLPIREIERGDVVVFKQPQEPEIDFIKRVVGLPGDTVELREGLLYVNGSYVEEPHVEEEYRRLDRNGNYGPIAVEPDNYFVLGDHRNQSQDSRFWGQVPRGLMKGRALLIWWSFYDPRERQQGLTVPLGERGLGWLKKVRYSLRPCGEIEKAARRDDHTQGKPCTEFGRCLDLIR
jgi:signal peptidase I